jgi:hypothetical protein
MSAERTFERGLGGDAEKGLREEQEYYAEVTAELEAVRAKLFQLESPGRRRRGSFSTELQHEKLAQYEERLLHKDEELENLKQALVGNKKRRTKKPRTKSRRKIAEDEPEDATHKSPNTILGLQDLQRRSMEAHGAKEAKMVWAFVFSMPPDSHSAISEEEAQGLLEEDETLDPGSAPVGVDLSHDRSMSVSHECWLFCEQVVGCDLVLNFVVPIDCKTIIVAIGASHEILVDEATDLKMLMRLQETKGALEFHPDLMRFYATNHGGLNEWENGHWIRRSTEDMTSGTHWMTDDMLTEVQLAFRQENEPRLFLSAAAQRLVMSRLLRLSRVDPMRMKRFATKSSPDTSTLNQVAHRSRPGDKRRAIPASMLHDLMLLFGGYRPQAGPVFDDRPDDRPEGFIQQLSRCIVADPQFSLRPDGLESSKSLQTDDLTYEDVCKVVQILEDWKAGRGKDEVWFGTLKTSFPLHIADELTYLRKDWASPKIIFRSVLIGYDSERQPAVFDVGPPKRMEMNTFGSCGNILHEHSFPWSLTYQPLEEIRDYFGDDVGLYFSWLGLYTAMLIICSLFGVVVMIAQPIYGGVENNPFTLAYSIYVGLWSISFLESWGRRESELRFLWGTADLKDIETPRSQFEGVLETDFETGRQSLEHKSMRDYYIKMSVANFICFLFILFTIVSALAAQTVRYIEPTNANGVRCIDMEENAQQALASGSHGGIIGNTYEGEEPCSIVHKMKFKIASSMLNLAIIGVYGFIFEGLADALASWENHRLDAEYDNSRVAKNFLFQFINNYFVLFYIAYMRELVDPITKAAHPCENGNCLGELQTQLLVVFTGKTIGKQIAYTLRPFVYKWFQSFLAKKVTKTLVKAAARGHIALPATMQAAMNNIISVAGGRNDPVQQLKRLKKVRNTYELQSHLQPYEGTFDDFNDRVIQFGYLVLFAPAFPLAPFFAFLNNVVEIRTGGYRLAVAYQRPVSKARSGIGSWLGVLKVLGFLAVITNASMITFVGSVDAEAMGLETTGFIDRTQQWGLWARFVLTEHCVLLVRVIILRCAPASCWLAGMRCDRDRA